MPRSRTTIALLVALALFSLLTALNAQDPPAPPLDTPVVLSGVVIEIERDGRAARLLLAEPEVVAGGHTLHPPRPLRVSFDHLVEVPALGTALRCDALIMRVRQPRNPTTVPRSEPPLFAQGLTIPQPIAHAPSWTTSVALALRQRLTFDSEVATALYRALILGDRSDLDPETRHAYQDTGTAHLLAISGMNLALFGWGLFRLFLFVTIQLAHAPLLRRSALATFVQGHRPRLVAAALACASTAAYTAVIAPSDATDRALAALAFTMAAIACLRTTTGWRVLAACFFAGVALRPEAITSAGFQLSFAATASLVAVAPHVARLNRRLAATHLHPLVRRALVFLGALVIADVACFLATAPLTIAWFGQLPLHGLWVNLVAIPFMTLCVFPLGVIWTVLATLVPPLGELTAPALVHVGEAFTDFVRLAGEAAGPASTTAWPLALGVLVSAALVATLTLGRRALPLGLSTLALGAALVAITLTPPAGLTLIALDVGHGDALLLRLPDGQRVLVDTGGRRAHGRFGGDPNRALAERVLVPALRASGFSAIDLLVLTHADLDHTGAARALVDRIPVARVWLPPCADSPSVRALVDHLDQRGVPIEIVARAPPFDLGGARFELLGPPGTLGLGPECPADNDTSLVIRVSYAGRSLLLTGDAESPAERELLASYPPSALRSDVLKVPHHGSRTSSTEAFLDAVAPRIAIVPGLPGRRPPPHPAVLERYAARAIPTFVTGSDGATTVHIDPHGMLTTHMEVLRPP